MKVNPENDTLTVDELERMTESDLRERWGDEAFERLAEKGGAAVEAALCEVYGPKRWLLECTACKHSAVVRLKDSWACPNGPHANGRVHVSDIHDPGLSAYRRELARLILTGQQ